MTMIEMAVIDELLRFISEGSILGLPSSVVMVIPFILGLIVGFLVKRVLKIAVVVGLIIAAVAYLGLFNLSLEGLKDIVTQYGPQAAHYAVILLGMLPLSVGFIIGLIIGFLFG